MKSFQGILALAIIALVAASPEEHCYSNTKEACNGYNDKAPECNALFSGYANHAEALQSYANQQLAKSYDYLLLATNFGSHLKNRPGFEKQFLALSNKAWDNTINLIKQMTKRGGRHNFTQNYLTNDNMVFELNELPALAFALDSEKTLSTEAHKLHLHYSHTIKEQRDPEMAHYLEENFLEDQVDTIRKLSGYTNDLKRLIDEKDKSTTLNLYLFDEYLSSQ